jgi:hypothetical protein
MANWNVVPYGLVGMYNLSISGKSLLHVLYKVQLQGNVAEDLSLTYLLH